MNTLKYSLLFFFLFYFSLSQAQSPLSSAEIRHASGKGPFPIYVTGQAIIASTKNNFRPFNLEYRNQNSAADVSRIRGLDGVEVNIGFVLNEKSIINRFTFEYGFRRMRRTFSSNLSATTRIQHDDSSIRIGYRGRILAYPFTYQVQTGPIFYASSRVWIEENRKITLNESILDLRTVSAWDTRVRIMLFDPAGTTGGLGFYFEFQYRVNFRQRSLEPLYAALPTPGDVFPSSSWNYPSFSIGLITPLAIRWISK